MACDKAGGSDIDKGTVKWVTLWSGQPGPCKQKPRIFSPLLKKTDFATSLIRLELCHRYLDYYTELDSVMLVGTKLPPDIDVHTIQHAMLLQQLEPKIKGSSNIADGVQCCDKKETVSESLIFQVQDLSLGCPSLLSSLPKEIIQLILSYLDIRSLCRLSQTCYLLRDLCYDTLLYTDLNLQPFWMQITNHSLLSLSQRCGHTRRLNLSWLGKGSCISPKYLQQLLQSCADSLRVLELSSCKFVNTGLLRSLVEICSNLTELNLSSCTNIEDFSVFHVVATTNLKKLNVYRTRMDAASIIAIIRSSTCLEHLNVASCNHMNPQINQVLRELGLHCRKLRSVDLWRMKCVQADGLASVYNNCLLLEELDLGWCVNLKSESECFTNLAIKCQHLKKLFLTANRTVQDSDVVALANYCPQLQQLDILGSREVTPSALQLVLEKCKQLMLLDVSFCLHIGPGEVCSWRAAYPGTAIKLSFQNFSTS